ncbi:hypothetical protein T484DRAFT_1947926 [Baffinella frigidus]|nr:hypothetical protein T484DRAFT_1947926 [Cryptophyta sp. CCMP2293]
MRDRSPPPPPSSLSIREIDLSFLKGHRVMPYERQSFLRDVRQMPSSLATCFSGRWKNPLSSSSLKSRLFLAAIPPELQGTRGLRLPPHAAFHAAQRLHAGRSSGLLSDQQQERPPPPACDQQPSHTPPFLPTVAPRKDNRPRLAPLRRQPLLRAALALALRDGGPSQVDLGR